MALNAISGMPSIASDHLPVATGADSASAPNAKSKMPRRRFFMTPERGGMRRTSLCWTSKRRSLVNVFGDRSYSRGASQAREVSILLASLMSFEEHIVLPAAHAQQNL